MSRRSCPFLSPDTLTVELRGKAFPHGGYVPKRLGTATHGKRHEVSEKGNYSASVLAGTEGRVPEGSLRTGVSTGGGSGRGDKNARTVTSAGAGGLLRRGGLGVRAAPHTASPWSHVTGTSVSDGDQPQTRRATQS